MFEATRRAGVLRLEREGTDWLSTGWDGGFRRADAAYLLTVPAGWERTDLNAYVAERCDRAGFAAEGPALLTAVELENVRGARRGPVEAYATAGLSNPAALPMDTDADGVGEPESGADADAGTVNVIVGTDRALGEAALANLLAVAVEAKAATLLSATGFPGTTTDAAIVAADPTGEATEFTGSGTPVGAAARVCVRDAVLAGLRAVYPDGDVPGTVAEAEYGTVAEGRATVFTV